jgi:hypothetical protein
MNWATIQFLTCKRYLNPIEAPPVTYLYEVALTFLYDPWPPYIYEEVEPVFKAVDRRMEIARLDSATWVDRGEIEAVYYQEEESP